MQTAGILVIGLQLRDLGKGGLCSLEVLTLQLRLAFGIKFHEVLPLYPLEISTVMVGHLQLHAKPLDTLLVILGIQVGGHGISF